MKLDPLEICATPCQDSPNNVKFSPWGNCTKYGIGCGILSEELVWVKLGPCVYIEGNFAPLD